MIEHEAIVDDAELLRMAERPADPLMPVLERSSAMWPLVVVFALFPITFATYYRTLDETAAAWGMRAVDALAADTHDERLAPGGPSTRFAAPLASWLQAGVLSIAPRGWPVAIVAVSAFATAGTVIAVYFTLSVFVGTRFALWTALLVCCHPMILAAGTTPAPTALGACVQVACLGGLLRHRVSTNRRFGWWGFVTGVMLGLTLLTSGPAFVVAVVTAIVYVVLRALCGIPDRPGPGRAARWRVIAIALLLVVAALVGGWWLVVVVVAHGPSVIPAWLSLSDGATVEGAGESLEIGSSLIAVGGVLVGFSAVGAWRCLVLVRDESDEPRRVSALLLAWLSVAILARTVVGLTGTRGPALAEWSIALVVPMLALAVVGMESVRSRTIGTGATACIAVGSLLIWWINPVSGPSATLEVVLASAAIVLLVIGAWRTSRATDEWKRAYAGCVLVAFVATQVFLGFDAARRTTDDDRALRAFQGELADVEAASHVVLVGDDVGSERVRLVAHVLWPSAPIERMPTRDEAIAVLLREIPIGETGVVIDTNVEASRPLAATAERFEETVVSPKRSFRGRRVRAHVLTRRETHDDSTTMLGES